MKNKTVHLQKIRYLLTFIICCASLLVSSQTTPSPQKDPQAKNIETREYVEDSALELLLKKSARYCQKLKKVTFNFTCSKEVIDNHWYWYWGGYLKDDYYLYHYQMVREKNGEMNEEQWLKRRLKRGLIRRYIPELRDRYLLEKKKEEIAKSQDQQIFLTNFFSSYPFLMPISMLGEENQSKYCYRLLDTEILPEQTLYKVSVEPKQKGVMEKDSNYGVVWIDKEDGSVYKIKLDPNSLESLGGSKELIEVAQQKKHRVEVTNVHWYEVKCKGIRFPSRTEINCSFLEWNQVARMINRYNIEPYEKVGTVFAYKKYNFFNVNVDVVESDRQRNQPIQFDRWYGGMVMSGKE